jgi:hypothetical protein
MFLFLRRAFAAASVTENRVRLSVQPLIVKKDAAGSHPGESTNSYFVGEHKWNREILSRLPPFDKESGALNIIVETPKNGRIKYKYNEEYGMFQFDKSLPSGFLFRSNSPSCPRQLGEMETHWMFLFCPTKRRLLDALYWVGFWESYKRSRVRENR